MIQSPTLQEIPQRSVTAPEYSYGTGCSSASVQQSLRAGLSCEKLEVVPPSRELGGARQHLNHPQEQDSGAEADGISGNVRRFQEGC